jgi:hypothetical protein
MTGETVAGRSEPCGAVDGAGAGAGANRRCTTLGEFTLAGLAYGPFDKTLEGAAATFDEFRAVLEEMASVIDYGVAAMHRVPFGVAIGREELARARRLVSIGDLSSWLAEPESESLAVTHGRRVLESLLPSRDELIRLRTTWARPQLE